MFRRLCSFLFLMLLTPAIVRYRVAGFKGGVGGMAFPLNRVIAKVSRVEVAAKFLAPAPDKFIQALIESGDLSRQQAEWAREIPVAHDLTAEADSGGHTEDARKLHGPAPENAEIAEIGCSRPRAGQRAIIPATAGDGQ